MKKKKSRAKTMKDSHKLTDFLVLAIVSILLIIYSLVAFSEDQDQEAVLLNVQNSEYVATT